MFIHLYIAYGCFSYTVVTWVFETETYGLQSLKYLPS